MTIKQIKVYAPASIANLGPGFDVFGIALDGLGDYVKVRRVSEPGVRVKVKGFEAGQIPVKAQLNSATHQVEMSRASLASAQEILDKTTVAAPITGTISKLNSEVASGWWALPPTRALR